MSRVAITVVTQPKLDRPPAKYVEAALRAIPAILNPLAIHRCGQPEGTRDYEYNNLKGRLGTDGHNRDAAEWAIHEHVESGRLVAIPGRGLSFPIAGAAGGVFGPNYRIGGLPEIPISGTREGVYFAGSDDSTRASYSTEQELCFLRWTEALREWWHDIESPKLITENTPLIPPKPKQKRRGRKSLNTKSDNRIWDAWNSGNHADFIGLANALGLPKKKVEDAIDRVRKRRKKLESESNIKPQ